MSDVGVHRLTNEVRDYPWGSTTVIPELLGLEPTGEPVAELWMGAHPAAPSVLRDDPDATGLDALIAADPDRWLGHSIARRFGRRLPFLLKVLAADRPLSFQAHPSLAQAKAGFKRENDAGLALDDPRRSYRDANHKPEQLCALTDFVAICGFRPVADSAAFLDHLDVPELTGYRERLVAEGGLRDVVTSMLTSPQATIDAALSGLLPGLHRVASGDGAWSAESHWIASLARDYPGDRGVLVAALLNLVRLAPGESLFLSAGQVHMYLHGVGIEVMANSDNVLRGGLTSKHVDVAELMHVLDVSDRVIAPTPATEQAPGVWVYPSGVPDFVLSRLQPTPATTVRLEAGGPRIVLCVEGSVSIAGQRLGRGESAFLAAGTAADLAAPDGPATAFLAAANV